MVQLIISSAVTLLVAVVGIVSTCMAAKSAAKYEVQKTVSLQFVKTFEDAIQGLSAILDLYVSFQSLVATVMSKEALALRVGAILEHGKACAEAAKKADPAIYLLNVYFPDPGHETVNSRSATVAINALVAQAVEIVNRTNTARCMSVSDEEYARYQEMEKSAASEMESLQHFYSDRREYFIKCYAEWRKKNFSFLKGASQYNKYIAIFARKVRRLKGALYERPDCP